MPKLFLFTLLLNLLFPLDAHAAKSIWGDGGFSGLAESLPHADPRLLEQTLGREWTNVIYRSGLEPQRVFKADFSQIDPVMERAVASKLGILELFTDIELANASSPALLLDASVLQRIDSKYDLSSVWMLSATPKGGPPNTLKMRYMIVGQGVLIMGYPHGSIVEIFDDGKVLEYQYESVISARIIHNNKNRGLYGVRTLASPSEEFSDFRGPMGVSIKAYEVKGSRVRVEYHLVVDQETEVAKKPIIIRDHQGFYSP